MRRRDFFELAAAGAVATSISDTTAKWPAKAPAKKANLKLGTQHGDSVNILKVMAALGVNHVCALSPSLSNGEDWAVDALSGKRERIASFALKAAALRLLHPTTIAKSEIANVMLGKSPERDREIDGICERIRNASKAGFPMLTYNLS